MGKIKISIMQPVEYELEYDDALIQRHNELDQKVCLRGGATEAEEEEFDKLHDDIKTFIRETIREEPYDADMDDVRWYQVGDADSWEL